MNRMKKTLSMAIIAILCISTLSVLGPVFAVPFSAPQAVFSDEESSSGLTDLTGIESAAAPLSAQTAPSSFQQKTFYHKVTQYDTKSVRIECPSGTEGGYLDAITGKYYVDTLTQEAHELTVPDPAGRVTVWSNMVFQGTGWTPKAKTIVHPDSISQSILHVSGQSVGDQSSRYLIVKIFNPQYPGGYQLDYSTVSGTFDKAYDVTGIVSQREFNNVSVTVTTYEGYWNVQAYFQVSITGADVYVVMIPGVTTSYVTDMDAVRRGVEASCMVKPLVHVSTWKPLTYLEITDMSTYQYIVEHPDYVRPPAVYPDTGIILVNAHGEVMPLPSGYSWQSWISLIAYQTRMGGLTWAQVAGYPFFYYSHTWGDQTQIGEQGFRSFLQPALGSSMVDCWPDYDGVAVPLMGGYSNRLWGYGLIDGGLHQGRPIAISKSSPTDKDSWTEQVDCSDGTWSGDVSADSSVKNRGASSIRLHVGWWGTNSSALFTFDNGKEVNMNQYPYFAVDLYLDGGGIAGCDTGDETVVLRDTSGRAAQKDFHHVKSGEFYTLFVKDKSGWTAESGFDFSRIKSVRIDRYMTMWHGDNNAWIDGMFFDNGAVNVADVLDVMYRISNGVKYLTLGLVGVLGPNDNVTLDHVQGYYVHNGAHWSDSDYNKGKYTMATAAWPKISLLYSTTWADIYYRDFWGNTYYAGKVRSEIAWTSAVPPLSGGNWKVQFVTTTMACANEIPPSWIAALADANAPLKITSSTSGTTFQFMDTYSTALVDPSEGEWQRILMEGIFWTAIGVILVPFTDGVGPSIMATIGLGFVQTGVSMLTYKSPNIERGQNGYVDLAMKDFSDVRLTDQSGNNFKQLQSFGYTEVGLPPSGTGAAGTLTFEFGQRCWYVTPDTSAWFEGIQTVQNVGVVVEPRQSGDSNSAPLRAQPPQGPNRGFKNTQYTYSAVTTDPEGDDIKYTFDWGDGTTTTGWYESGNTAFTTHQWANYNNPWPVKVQLQDSQGAWNAVSDPLNVAIVPKLVITTSLGGTTNPLPGTYAYDYGSFATVTAVPDSAYVFDHWVLDGSNVYGNPTNVLMTSDRSLQAFFAEQNLTTVLANLGFTNIRASTLENFIPGNYSAPLYAEIGDWHNSCELAWYSTGSSQYNLIFSGPEGNFGYTNPPITKSFTANSKFGLSIYTPQGGRFFTETARNSDGVKHAMVYQNLNDPDVYFIGFEHGAGGADLDYNDMVIKLELVTPPVVNISGTNWYYKNATNTRALIFLDGGYAYSLSVRVVSWDNYYGETPQKALFINDMIQNGFDVLVNKDDLPYDGTQTFVKNASQWLWDRGYRSVFVLGFSAGGVVMASEIQKDYASAQFSAAVICSAPVDWDSWSSAPIYQSAHTASKDKVATLFIEGVTDDYRAQLLNYYNNATIDKSWNNWNDGHDVFTNTSQDHPGESVQTAVTNWFNAAHRPNTPQTPSGLTVADLYYAYYPYTTVTIDPNEDNLTYTFNWGDGLNSTVGPYVSRTSAYAYHAWNRTGTYNVTVQAKDIHNSYSLWSSNLTVSVIINDDGTHTDANNTFANATIYNNQYQTGTLLLSNPTDPEDWYQFNATVNQTISVWLSSSLGCNFDLELYYPNGTRRAFSNSTSSYDSIYVTATVNGSWRMRLYRVSGEGLYYFGAQVYYPGGGGGCPTLFTWSGSKYVDYGVINIHDGTSTDLLRTVPITTKDLAVKRGIAQIRLREGWPGLNFSESVIDQVRLYAIDSSGNQLLCPLFSARHSTLGNVLPQLLFSDDNRVQSLLLETIDLKFLVPYRNIRSFIFVIEGYNAYKM